MSDAILEPFIVAGAASDFPVFVASEDMVRCRLGPDDELKADVAAEAVRNIITERTRFLKRVCAGLRMGDELMTVPPESLNTVWSSWSSNVEGARSEMGLRTDSEGRSALRTALSGSAMK